MAGLNPVTVVGGGLVGLATARQLALRGEPVRVLEAEDGLARHQSGHNSGVIHSGLYYKPGSEKAKLCTEGRRALYTYCQAKEIPHRRTGKIVTAVDDSEIPRLDELERRGRANGLAGLERWSAGELAERFPWAAGRAALWVPETGLVDYPAVARALADDVRRSGGEVVTGARLTGIVDEPHGPRLETTAGDFPARFLIACAGLQSDRVARLAGTDPGVRIVPFRGEYYEVASPRRELVTVPVYPVPDPRFPFLGVHLTPTLDGRLEAGPNAVLSLARSGYERKRIDGRDVGDTLSWPGFWRFGLRHLDAAVMELRRSWSRRRFARDLARLVPAVETDDLTPGGWGLRAQALDRQGLPLDDFRFARGPKSLHVLNAPSPAATAGLAIGRRLAAEVMGE